MGNEENIKTYKFAKDNERPTYFTGYLSFCFCFLKIQINIKMHLSNIFGNIAKLGPTVYKETVWSMIIPSGTVNKFWNSCENFKGKRKFYV